MKHRESRQKPCIIQKRPPFEHLPPFQRFKVSIEPRVAGNEVEPQPEPQPGESTFDSETCVKHAP